MSWLSRLAHDLREGRGYYPARRAPVDEHPERLADVPDGDFEWTADRPQGSPDPT
jgi:hypothetical protein